MRLQVTTPEIPLPYPEDILREQEPENDNTDVLVKMTEQQDQKSDLFL